MRYSIYLSNIDECSSAALLAELAHEVEEAGWDGGFIWDHISGPQTVADPWIVLAGLWGGATFSYSGKHYHIKDACFLPRPVQSLLIPIWTCGMWSDKKAPFRRAARWDGAIAIADISKNRPILPDEVCAVKAYIRQHRLSDDLFDVVVILWSEGEHTAEEQQEVARYRNAGMTWWLEDLSTERFATLKEARERLHKGPPSGE